MDNLLKLKGMLKDAIKKCNTKAENISLKLEDVSAEILQNMNNIDRLQTKIAETSEVIKKMKKYKKLQQKCDSYVVPFFCAVSTMLCSLPFILEGTLNIFEVISSKYAMLALAEVLVTSYCVSISSYYRKLNKDLINPYTLSEEIEYLAKLYEQKANEERILGNNLIYSEYLIKLQEVTIKEKANIEAYLKGFTNNEVTEIKDNQFVTQTFNDVMKRIRTKQ